jgi:hypothetical protein
MNRLLALTSVRAFALTTSTTFAVEQTRWGQLKQSLTQDGDNFSRYGLLRSAW